MELYVSFLLLQIVFETILATIFEVTTNDFVRKYIQQNIGIVFVEYVMNT